MKNKTVSTGLVSSAPFTIIKREKLKNTLPTFKLLKLSPNDASKSCDIEFEINDKDNDLLDVFVKVDDSDFELILANKFYGKFTHRLNNLTNGNHLIQFKIFDKTDYILTGEYEVIIKDVISDDLFDKIELITDPNVKGGEFVRVAIKLTAKDNITSKKINVKITPPSTCDLKNTQWEKSPTLSDYRKSINEIYTKNASLEVKTTGIEGIVSDTKKFYETTIGDITNLRLKANYSDHTVESPGEILMYGIKRDSSNTVNGELFPLILNGETYKYTTRYLNPGHENKHLPLGRMCYLLLKPGTDLVYAIWEHGNSNSGWKIANITEDQISNDNFNDYEININDVLIGEFKLDKTDRELITECNCYKAPIKAHNFRSFSTKAELDYTSEKFGLTFESIGIKNELINSDFREEINTKPFGNDYTFLRWDDSAGGACSIGIDRGPEWVPPGKRAIQVFGRDFTLENGECHLDIRGGFDCPKFKVTPGKVYRVALWFSGHRLKDFVLECLCYSKDGNRLMDDSHRGIFEIGPKTGGLDINDWGKAEYAFTAQQEADFCCIRIYMGKANINTNGADSNTCYLWILEPMVNSGPVFLDYTASTNEYMIGSSEFTKDGLKVSMADGQGPQGYSTISYDGLSVKDPNGNNIAHFGQGNTAQIGDLNVTGNLSNRHLIKWGEAIPWNLYVAPYATGDGTGRDINNKSNSINHALLWARNTYGCYMYQHDLNVFIENGNYHEHVYVGGWLGSGILHLSFSADVILSGKVTVEENTMPVKITGGRYSYYENTGCIIYADEHAFIVRNSLCFIDGFRSRTANHYPNYGGAFVKGNYGARVLISNCDLVKYWHVAHGDVFCHFHIADTRGDVQQIAENSFNCTYYLLGVNRPLINSGSEFLTMWNTHIVHSPGTRINSLWIPKDEAPPPPPPEPSYQWMEATFALTNLRSIPEGSGSATSTRYGEIGQGKWGSWKPHRGYGDLGDGPANWCSGGRNFNVTLTMTRLNTNHGVAGNTPRPRIKNSSGNFWDCGIGFARGSTHTITLPSDIIDAIVNGRMKTIELWAGASTNDYSFYNNASIRITCEKQI